MKFLSAFLLLAGILPTFSTTKVQFAPGFDPLDEAQLSTVLSQVGFPAERHRDLQLEQIFEVITFICDVISAALEGAAECQCLLGLTIGFSCDYIDPVCFGGRDDLCAQPALTGGLNILQGALQFEFCTGMTTESGADVPGACFNFDVDLLGFSLLPMGDILGTILSIGSGNSDPQADSIGADMIKEEENEKKKKVKKAGKSEDEESVKKPKSIIKRVQASVGGESCKEASPCEGGQGYIFDCSNIPGGMVQSKCRKTHFIDSLWDKEPMVFLPDPDE